MPAGVGDASVGSDVALERRKAVVRWALGASWVWLVALAVLAAVAAYLSLLCTSFTAEALNGEVTARVILLAVGLPALALLLAAVAGFVTGFVVARGLLRVALLARVHPWALGFGASGLGALVAVTVFWASMAGAHSIGSS
ncbi:hypothetical protein [Phycicoccus sp. SLBN-51]|jgi:hypothetical protein|uniref:hypothetical protein n=1 Tax=Phycicoccus sp. SLBN-51 TaxID=2768447 RepID=UPI001168B14A|nr:hypothetical protein [Phycicoccus sp. SLBN-51]TQJ52182.1 hypothetical protein FBY26_3930 [Phycicoccus sp. SLBN-51]